jgi:hypothetical protein
MTFTTKDRRPEQTLIARRKITLTTIISENTKSITIPINGELLQYVIDATELTDTDTTYDFTITNEDSEIVYTNTGMAETVSTLVLLSAAPIPMAGSLTFTCAFTTAQVATFDIYLYYR